MARPTESLNLFGSDATAAATRLACLFVLRVFRGLRLPVRDDMPFAHIAHTLWPAFHQDHRLLKAALGKLKADEAEDDMLLEWADADEVDAAPPVEPLSRGLAKALGAALVNDATSCRRLFDSSQRRLQSASGGDESLAANIGRLREMLGLSELETRLLTVCAAFDISGMDTSLFTCIRSGTRIVGALAKGLDWADEHEVRALLKQTGALHRSGLLNARPADWPDLEEALKLSRQGAMLLRSHFAGAHQMAAAVLKPLAEARQSEPLAWPHLEDRTSLIIAMLKRATRDRLAGINLLLYGAPGTGKTEYAKALVRDLGFTGYGVDDTDDDGAARSRAERLSSLMLTQAFAPPGQSVLVLDEAEDIFTDDYGHSLARLFGASTPRGGKSWMNHLLEDNRAPVIWIANQIGHMDPAYLRRFTYCLEFPRSPRPVRRAVARAHLSTLGCSAELVEEVVANDSVTPAMLASAAQFARLASAGSGAAPDDAIRHALADNLKAMGQDKPWTLPERGTRFDFRYLHVQGPASPQAVLQALARQGRGTLLLDGPPGTGKTQFAAEIAQQLGRELVCRTAADINSMWYGESERNVARLFAESDPASEVLFLDEAETLLGARDGAGHRADTAVTAEFLRRIEAYAGIFVCATNHRAAFDAALMRRFHFRLQFQPLDADQRLGLLCESALGWNPAGAAPQPLVDDAAMCRLARLDRLTPGDFANAGRRIRALGLPATIDAWLDELQAEHDAKPDGHRATMGFL